MFSALSIVCESVCCAAECCCHQTAPSSKIEGRAPTPPPPPPCPRPQAPILASDTTQLPLQAYTCSPLVGRSAVRLQHSATCSLQQISTHGLDSVCCIQPIVGPSHHTAPLLHIHPANVCHSCLHVGVELHADNWDSCWLVECGARELCDVQTC